jgi:zinc transporter ZupT
MDLNVIIIIILSIIFGALFFITEFFDERINIRLHVSFIAGISVAYFFLILLPEIAHNLPEFPLGLEIFEYLFIFFGFSFIHVSEKLILQRVESKSQEKVRELYEKEKLLEAVEKNIENTIDKEILKDDVDNLSLKMLANVVVDLNKQNKEINTQIEETKRKIQMHIENDLNELRFFTNFFYHFIVGIILLALLFIDFLQGILFFIFAFFRIIISNRSDLSDKIYTDLDIEIQFKESQFKKFILAFSTLTGVIIGLFFEFLFQVDIELIYILYSFISGVILYTIVREVIPEKEKGKPIYFLIGAAGFTIIILLINIFTTLIQLD